MQNYYLTYFIAIWGLTNAVLAVLSVGKIKKNKNKCDFIWWWAFPTGSFVWEDMLVFGILHSALSFVSLATSSNRLWIVSFLTFWVVRSTGEVLYYFLQQFIVPKHHPHDLNSHFNALRRLFGNISDQKFFIMMQVFLQSILVLSVLGLIYALTNPTINY